MTHPIANEMIAQQRGAELRKDAADYRRARQAKVVRQGSSNSVRKGGLRFALRQPRKA